MSAWPIPDEVVKALANALCAAFDLGCGRERQYKGPCDKHLEIARDFLERHRLVQLPEEPQAWEAEIARDGWYTYGPTENRMSAEQLAADFRATGRIRPVYRIPGQPITVDKEESDGQA